MSNMPPLNTSDGSAYYASGSRELQTETPLTLNRLEPRRKLTATSSALVIVLVGLPARGKSFISRKLQTFLRWTGCQCKIFNVGKYRRQAYAELSLSEDGIDLASASNCDANFFDPNNKEAAALREKVAEVALQDVLDWLEQGDDLDDGSEDQPHRPRVQRCNSSISDSEDSKRLTWGNDRVAIFDATNSTHKRRQWILETCTKNRAEGKPIGVVFIESICDDLELLEENYRFKVCNSPDYVDIPQEEALADIRQRVKKYEDAYETINDDALSYIKIYNLSTKMMVNHIYGRMSKLIVPALMAWHIGTRPVYLCRPGQTPGGVTLDSDDYVSKVDTNDPSFLNMSLSSRKKMCRGEKLGAAGIRFRKALYDFVADESAEFLVQRASTMDNVPTGTSRSGLSPFIEGDVDEDEDAPPFPLRILTSTMLRSRETVLWKGFEQRIDQMSALNPLDKGDFVGKELEQLQFSNREWYESLEQDPFHTRFQGGECYRDLINRLGPVIIDIEQQVIPTLVVSHVSILQTLIAYFRNSPVEQSMSIEVPLHTVIKFTPVRGGGWSESHHPLLAEHEHFLPYVISESEISQLSMNNSMSSLPTQPIWGDHMKFHRVSLTPSHRQASF